MAQLSVILTRCTNMELGAKLRASNVERWHMVHLLKKQSVAEHLFNVAMIVDDLVKRIGFTDDRRSKMVQAALLHDIHEVVTGDVTSPTGRRMREFGCGMELLYPEATDWMDGLLPEEVAIIKIADLLEMAIFLRDYGGTNEAEVILSGINQKLSTICSDDLPFLKEAINGVLASSMIKEIPT